MLKRNCNRLIAVVLTCMVAASIFATYVVHQQPSPTALKCAQIQRGMPTEDAASILGLSGPLIGLGGTINCHVFVFEFHDGTVTMAEDSQQRIVGIEFSPKRSAILERINSWFGELLGSRPSYTKLMHGTVYSGPNYCSERQ